MNKYAVMGHPIAHSKSPQIHRLFAEQTGETMTYEKIEVEPQHLDESLKYFFKQGGKGLNITVPLKTLAWQRMHQLNNYAKRAKAVNTIKLQDDGSLGGYNTDGIGLLRDLTQNHHIELNNRSILILGAGGAVQGVLKNLLERNPKQLCIANRTIEKATALANEFSDLGNIEACAPDEINNAYDLIINGTSASLTNALPNIPDDCLTKNGIVYDMMYSDKPTAFVQWGKQHGAKHAFDGLGMLIEQAAEAFHIWRDVRPNTAPIFKALRPGV